MKTLVMPVPDAPFGWLINALTEERVRPATRDELRRCLTAAINDDGAGIFQNAEGEGPFFVIGESPAMLREITSEICDQMEAEGVARYQADTPAAAADLHNEELAEAQEIASRF